MTRYRRIARVADVAPGTARVVEVDGSRVALYNVGGRFYATSNTCPHQGASLAEGYLSGCVITCPQHFWQFDVTTGRSPEFPELRVERYAVKVDGDDVLVSGEPMKETG